MNTILFFGFLLGLAVFSLIIGKNSSKRLKSIEDYFLSGRGLGVFALAATLLATQLGGGTLIGAADEAYRRGWVVLLYPLGNCLGLLLLGLGFGAKLRSLNLTTITELFEVIYKSKWLRKGASVLSIASLFCILITQGIAARKFFYFLGFDQWWLFLIFWSIVVWYTVIGGLSAVVKTDILQVLFVVGALAASFAVVMIMKTSQAAAGTDFVVKTQTSVPWVGWLLMPMAFAFIEQDMGQRCFASKSPKAISAASIMAAVAMLLSIMVPIYFSTLANKLGLEIPPGASILMTAVTELTNPVITAFFSCAILMAIISTADSLICAISSNLVCDFPVLESKKTSQKIRLAQIITFIIGMASLCASFYFNDIVSMMIMSYELSVSMLFIPVVMAVLSKKPSFKGAVCAIVLGGISFVIFRIWPIMIPREVCNLLFSYSGYYLGKKCL